MLGCPADEGWQAGRHTNGTATRYCGSKVHIGCSRDENFGMPNER